MTNFKKAFSFIYDNKVWGNGSGGGSSLENNTDYIKFLTDFIKENDIDYVVDFGCGDWQFSRHIVWGHTTYLGIDTVESVIETNNKLFANSNIFFRVSYNLEDAPADLLIIKDVFQHWNNKDITSFLKKYAKRYKYILCTNTINGSWQHETEPNVITRPITANEAQLKDFGFNVVKVIDQNKTDLKEIALLINK